MASIMRCTFVAAVLLAHETCASSLEPSELSSADLQLGEEECFIGDCNASSVSLSLLQAKAGYKTVKRSNSDRQQTSRATSSWGRIAQHVEAAKSRRVTEAVDATRSSGHLHRRPTSSWGRIAKQLKYAAPSSLLQVSEQSKPSDGASNDQPLVRPRLSSPWGRIAQHLKDGRVGEGMSVNGTVASVVEHSRRPTSARARIALSLAQIGSKVSSEKPAGAKVATRPSSRWGRIAQHFQKVPTERRVLATPGVAGSEAVRVDSPTASSRSIEQFE